MTFEELLATLRTPGETPPPETIFDDLHAAYQNDLAVRDAAVKARETTIAEKDSAIQAAELEALRLKSVNYDLLMSKPATGKEKEPEPETSEVAGIDSLFG